MKKIFTLITFATIALTANSQRLLVEDFNYVTGGLTDGGTGTNVSGGNWITVPLTTGSIPLTDFAKVVAGNLSYPNYFTGPSAASNRLDLDSITTGQNRSIEDVFRNFAVQTSNTVYASFLMQFRATSNLGNSTSAGDYFISFTPTASASDYRARVFVRQGTAPNTIQYGIAATSVSASVPIVWSAVDRDASQVHLITFAYQFVPLASNDVTKLWVDKPFSTTEPAPDASSILAGTEPANISRIAIRQGTVAVPNATIDAIVVASSYADATLPLNLTSFKASFNGKATQLKWSTENEVNVSGFAIEKSLDGINFSQIDFVSAKNNSTHTEYSNMDDKVKGGTSYYRLKQVDKNGAFKYSSIEVIKNSLTIKTEVFPNPTRGNLTINHGVAIKGAAIKVMNIEGNLIKTMPVQSGSTQTALSVTELIKGNYLLVFQNDGTKSITQFSKQ
ncbi:MAG: T9SS type A sorting domain-containing protein [Chitinophagaceae bacterium]|nr:T9SS type A sorting domain-containing protein [Chitinophagaceae bacterium]